MGILRCPMTPNAGVDYPAWQSLTKGYQIPFQGTSRYLSSRFNLQHSALLPLRLFLRGALPLKRSSLRSLQTGMWQSAAEINVVHWFVFRNQGQSYHF